MEDSPRMSEDVRLETFLELMNPEAPADLLALEEKALGDGVPIIRRPVQSFLRFFLNVKKPGRILEVGTAVGFSALWMDRFSPEGCVITTMEKSPERAAEARQHFAEFGSEERITLLEGDAAELLKGLNGTYDLIFMDAAKGQYIHFLPEVKRLLAVGGVLISDNMLRDGELIESRFAVTRRNRTIHGRMREYLFALKEDPSLETVLMDVGDGLALSVKKED